MDKTVMLVLIIILSALTVISVLFLILNIVQATKKSKKTDIRKKGTNSSVKYIDDAEFLFGDRNSSAKRENYNGRMDEEVVLDTVPYVPMNDDYIKYIDALPSFIKDIIVDLTEIEKYSFAKVLLDGPKTMIHQPLEDYAYPMDFIYDFFSSIGVVSKFLSVEIIEKIYNYAYRNVRGSKELVFYNYCLIDTYINAPDYKEHLEKCVQKCNETLDVETNILKVGDCYVHSICFLIDYYTDTKNYKKALALCNLANRYRLHDAKGNNFDKKIDYLSGNF